jgi:hypothetical protein
VLPPTRTLADLEAHFIRIKEPGRLYETVDSLEAAQGVQMLCPRCFHEKGGAVGCHSLLLWFAGRGVRDEEIPGPGRWTPVGTGVGDLTFTNPGGPFSVMLNGHLHGFIENGTFRVDAVY